MYLIASENAASVATTALKATSGTGSWTSRIANAPIKKNAKAAPPNTVIERRFRRCSNTEAAGLLSETRADVIPLETISRRRSSRVVETIGSASNRDSRRPSYLRPHRFAHSYSDPALQLSTQAPSLTTITLRFMRNITSASYPPKRDCANPRCRRRNLDKRGWIEPYD